MKLNLLVIILSTALLATCGTSKDVASNEDKIDEALLLENFEQYKNSSPINIEAVTIESNTMILDVSYSGGCETHNFALLGLNSIEKTLPPKRSIMLFHNNGGDNCREFIKKSLKFDITSIGYKKGEYIMLKLEGWKDPIQYTLE